MIIIIIIIIIITTWYIIQVVEIIFEHTSTIQGKLKKTLLKKNKKGNFTALFQNSEGLLRKRRKIGAGFPWSR